MSRIVFVSAAVVSVLVAPAASAQETGLHKLHKIAPMGGKMCMTEHEHYGESPASSTKNVAMKLAVNKWIQFTADEYGKAWGSYALAVGKKEKCAGSAPNIVCSVTARPCRSGR